MSDVNKKTLRHFYCRDALWQTYEQMSEELDKGVDELINEAMKAHAKAQGYPVAEGPAGPSPARALDEPVPTIPPGPPRPPAGGRLPPPPPPMGGAMRKTQSIGGAGGAPPPPPRRVPGAPPPPPPPPRPTPPAAGADGEGAAAGAAPGTLFLVFQNQKYKIDKDQFIIGRGTKSSDLPIKDSNISRKHAAVIRRNGTYFIKDLGSTNGIDFKGMRIDNKRIDEGDVFHLCDYELKFTYRK